MTPEEVKQKLRAVIETFERKSLAHYLNFESSERKLTQEIKDEVKEKYGFEKFMPEMGWGTAFGNYADSDVLDEQIKKHLAAINYQQETFVMPMDRLKNMLWNNAREKGKQILSKYNSKT